ncbi:hypothetical protein F1C14_13315 [Clostridium perfringens]|nr:hypothetical protein F1C14_13315 [Clostridium perfringens]
MKISSIVMLAASFFINSCWNSIICKKKRFEGENQAGKYSAKYIQSNAIGNIFIGFLGTILGVLDNFVNGNSIKIAFVVIIIGGSIVQKLIGNKISK